MSRVVDRPHVSPWLLWSADHFTLLARQIEDARPDGRREPWIEHRAYVLGALSASSEFLEAFVNELFQDVTDQAAGLMGPGDWLSQITRVIDPALKARMVEYWTQPRPRPPGTREKYKALIKIADDQELEPRIYEDAAFLLTLRNAVVHYVPRDHFTADEARVLEIELKKRRIPANPLAPTIPRAYWLEKALSSEFARWAVGTAVLLTDAVSEFLSIDPDYARFRRHGGFGQAPGETLL